jgi:hypothetical protein
MVPYQTEGNPPDQHMCKYHPEIPAIHCKNCKVLVSENTNICFIKYREFQNKRLNENHAEKLQNRYVLYS